MPRYSAYIRDEHAHLLGAVKFDCADDEEAKERARQLDGDRVELWREVQLLEPDGPSERR